MWSIKSDSAPIIDNIIMTDPTIRFSNHIPLTLNHFLSLAIIYVIPNHQRMAPIPILTMPTTSNQNEYSGKHEAKSGKQPGYRAGRLNVAKGK